MIEFKKKSKKNKTIMIREWIFNVAWSSGSFLSKNLQLLNSFAEDLELQMTPQQISSTAADGFNLFKTAARRFLVPIYSDTTTSSSDVSTNDQKVSIAVLPALTSSPPQRDQQQGDPPPDPRKPFDINKYPPWIFSGDNRESMMRVGGYD